MIKNYYMEELVFIKEKINKIYNNPIELLVTALVLTIIGGIWIMAWGDNYN